MPEGLFDLHYLKGIETQGLMNVSQIAATAAGMCDIDTRPVSTFIPCIITVFIAYVF